MPQKILRTKSKFAADRLRTVRRVEASAIDERGSITNILDIEKFGIRSVLLITARAGSIRANHYHKKDSHYVYLLNGRMEYVEKNMSGRNQRKRTMILEPGDLVFSPPRVAHAMRFLEDSTFLAFTTEAREQRSYEKDTVRFKLL